MYTIYISFQSARNNRGFTVDDTVCEDDTGRPKKGNNGTFLLGFPLVFLGILCVPSLSSSVCVVCHLLLAQVFFFFSLSLHFAFQCVCLFH